MSEVQRVSISPKQAQQWLDQYYDDVQRPLRSAWVRQLAQKMKTGEFDQNSTIQLRVLGDDIHLLDGRHRLNALVMAGVPQSFYVITDEVADRDELVHAFHRVNQGKSATNRDIFAAAGLDTEIGLSLVQTNRLSGAVALISDNFAQSGSRELGIDERMVLIRHYGEAAALFFEATAKLTSAIRTPMRWAVTIAVACVTFDESALCYGQSKIDEFWSGIAGMVNEGNGDPRGLASRNLLKTVPYRSNGKALPGQEMRTAAYTARYLAGCFNAWVTDERPSRIVPSVERPIVIKGSKFR